MLKMLGATEKKNIVALVTRCPLLVHRSPERFISQGEHSVT